MKNEGSMFRFHLLFLIIDQLVNVSFRFLKILLQEKLLHNFCPLKEF